MDKILNLGPLVAFLVTEIIRYFFDERIALAQKNFDAISNREPLKALVKGTPECNAFIAKCEQRQADAPELEKIHNQIQQLKLFKFLVIIFLLLGLLFFVGYYSY